MRRFAAIVVLASVALLAAGCGDKPAAGPSAADYKAERERLLAKMNKNKAAKSEKAAVAVNPGAGKGKPGAQGEAPPEQGGFGAVAASYTYDPKGKRDPFEPYRRAQVEKDEQGPLMAYELEQLSVVAVVWDTGTPRALVADPRGEMHVVREGTPIGKNDGHVIHIGDNMVLVKETYIDFAGEMTTNDVELRIRSTQGG